MDERAPHQTSSGMPRWLVWGIAAKLVLVLAITLAIVLYANA